MRASQAAIAAQSLGLGTPGSGAPSRQVGAESTIRAPGGSSPTAELSSARAVSRRDADVPLSSTSSRGSPVTTTREAGNPKALTMRGATSAEETGNSETP